MARCVTSVKTNWSMFGLAKMDLPERAMQGNTRKHDPANTSVKPPDGDTPAERAGASAGINVDVDVAVPSAKRKFADFSPTNDIS